MNKIFFVIALAIGLFAAANAEAKPGTCRAAICSCRNEVFQASGLEENSAQRITKLRYRGIEYPLAPGETIWSWCKVVPPTLAAMATHDEIFSARINRDLKTAAAINRGMMQQNIQQADQLDKARASAKSSASAAADATNQIRLMRYETYALAVLIVVCLMLFWRNRVLTRGRSAEHACLEICTRDIERKKKALEGALNQIDVLQEHLAKSTGELLSAKSLVRGLLQFANLEPIRFTLAPEAIVEAVPPRLRTFEVSLTSSSRGIDHMHFFWVPPWDDKSKRTSQVYSPESVVKNLRGLEGERFFRARGITLKPHKQGSPFLTEKLPEYGNLIRKAQALFGVSSNTIDGECSVVA